MIKKFWITIIGALSLITTFAPLSASAMMHEDVFLAHTDHELHVYRISGDQPGKTMMIIGGIQGDEPSGYITADIYADIHLKKGNLIVVPRANFYSILLNRRNGETGDMNRKFSPKPGQKAYHLEEEVVAILKHLIAESDCLLNLHEGSGFFNPKWMNNMENPNRFGQSVIFDAEAYKPPYGKTTIHLGDIANRVIKVVNTQIKNPRYKFKANNHDTLSPTTHHREQRESATFYALTRAQIPAFGIETSKSIKNLKDKTRLHKLVINAMLQEFGIINDSPGIKTEPATLSYLILKVNNNQPYAMRNNDVLNLNIGDNVVVTDIIANYKRGLVADVENIGTSNDTNIPFRFSGNANILIRKDSRIIGRVSLMKNKRTPERKEIPLANLTADSLLVDVNGKFIVVPNNQTIKMKYNGRIIIHSIRTNIAKLDNNISVNLKGFAPPKVNNGNDLLYPIYTDHDLMPRFSVHHQGKRYPIIAYYQQKTIGKFWLELP